MLYVASMAGKLAVPGMAVYNASKFAAVGLSAAVREEYRYSGVSVSTVLPSAVHTAGGRRTARTRPADCGARSSRQGNSRQCEQPARRNNGAALSRGLGPTRRGDTHAVDALGPQSNTTPSGADFGTSRRARSLRRSDRDTGAGATMSREPRIVIVGAGVAGIATAVTLQHAGFRDFTIVEKGADVGGVWYWNHYPGLTCDVPSQLYQFSFAPKPDWSKGSLRRRDPALPSRGRRAVRPRRPDQIECRGYLGRLHRPDMAHRNRRRSTIRSRLLDRRNRCAASPFFTPDISGLNTFGGDVVHTARWDDRIATRDRRIAVIGTGSTGVQIVWRSSATPGTSSTSCEPRSGSYGRRWDLRNRRSSAMCSDGCRLCTAGCIPACSQARES